VFELKLEVLTFEVVVVHEFALVEKFELFDLLEEGRDFGVFFLELLGEVAVVEDVVESHLVEFVADFVGAVVAFAVVLEVFAFGGEFLEGKVEGVNGALVPVEFGFGLEVIPL
jgi:hypothetical protein